MLLSIMWLSKDHQVASCMQVKILKKKIFFLFFNLLQVFWINLYIMFLFWHKVVFQCVFIITCTVISLKFLNQITTFNSKNPYSLHLFPLVPKGLGIVTIIKLLTVMIHCSGHSYCEEPDHHHTLWLLFTFLINPKCFFWIINKSLIQKLRIRFFLLNPNNYSSIHNLSGDTER